MPSYRYEIEPRPVDLGGGWRLRMFEGDEEVGGGIFPPGDNGYIEALAVGDDWLAAQNQPDDAAPSPGPG